MSANTQTPETTRKTSGSGKSTNTLTHGQKPRWTWAAVLVGALVVSAAIVALLFTDFSIVWTVIFTAILYVIGMYIVTRAIEGKRKATDGLWMNLIWGAFLIALVPLISVIWTVVEAGLGTLITNPGILINDMQGVTGADDQATVNEGAALAGGIAHGLVGTLMITLMATIISVPIGLLASIYLVEYSNDNWLAKLIRFFVDVMTGIPSIVAGLFAISAMTVLFTTVMGDTPAVVQAVKMGLTASVGLSVLMIPTVVRSTEEMLRVVPNELREASYALGVRKWRTITSVVIPTAISGIASGVTLAIARVAGETAPILVTAGFAVSTNWNPFSGWMTALPVYIYRQLMNPLAPAASEPSTNRAWAGALVLIIIVMLLNLIARFIAKAFAPKTGK